MTVGEHCWKLPIGPAAPADVVTAVAGGMLPAFGILKAAKRSLLGILEGRVHKLLPLLLPCDIEVGLFSRDEVTSWNCSPEKFRQSMAQVARMSLSAEFAKNDSSIVGQLKSAKSSKPMSRGTGGRDTESMLNLNKTLSSPPNNFHKLFLRNGRQSHNSLSFTRLRRWNVVRSNPTEDNSSLFTKRIRKKVWRM